MVPDACSTPREEVYTWEKVQVLRVEGSVSRYSWDLESWGSWCRNWSYCFSEVLEERIKRRRCLVGSSSGREEDAVTG